MRTGAAIDAVNITLKGLKMKRYHAKWVVSLAAGVVFALLVVSCGQASPPPAATAVPAAPTTAATAAQTLAAPSPAATAVPATPAPVPSATPAPPSNTPTPAAKLQTDNFEFTVPVNEDDLDPIIPAIRNLSGVTDVQGGGNGLQVTYDPSRVSHKQIVDAIAGFGFHVKE